MDPRRFHNLAERLARSNEAAELRTAVSRAYYAVYNVAAAYLNQIVPLSRGPGGHGQVQRLLTNSEDVVIAQLGFDLGNLHSRRIDADYDMLDSKPETQKTVQSVVEKAGALIAALDQAFGGKSSEMIGKAVQRYWTEILREPLRDRKRIE